ncbi:hypothetical protein BJ166DRAFT_498908 [Pestalotiopsis sp. NC0098]|nr:hypothetical protein BJ166DRAFT_498908 [Pestalotiopsis sp. NC0098]
MAEIRLFRLVDGRTNTQQCPVQIGVVGCSSQELSAIFTTTGRPCVVWKPEEGVVCGSVMMDASRQSSHGPAGFQSPVRYSRDPGRDCLDRRRDTFPKAALS